MPKVSIIIPMYNVEKYIKEAIDSVLNQKTKYNYELIIVNDGATDNTKKIIQSIESDKIKYIEQEELLATNGNSIVYIAKNNEILGIIGVNDIIRGNAKNIIEELNKNNIEVMMLTGDNKKNC